MFHGHIHCYKQCFQTFFGVQIVSKTILPAFKKGGLRDQAFIQQFVVATTGSIDSAMVERWTNYYDIFLRNAFGNFRNILREVTWNPVMGDWLTYRGNKKFDHNSNYPDENYAREVMQLFTIGLFELNEDGTRKKDANGDDMPTYDNDHVMNFARIFTGFERELMRGGIEIQKGKPNIVDPMQMHSSYHDVYPKPDLKGRGERSRSQLLVKLRSLIADIQPFFFTLCGLPIALKFTCIARWSVQGHPL